MWRVSSTLALFPFSGTQEGTQERDKTYAVSLILWVFSFLTFVDMIILLAGGKSV